MVEGAGVTRDVWGGFFLKVIWYRESRKEVWVPHGDGENGREHFVFYSRNLSPIATIRPCELRFWGGGDFERGRVVRPSYPKLIEAHWGMIDRILCLSMPIAKKQSIKGSPVCRMQHGM